MHINTDSYTLLKYLPEDERKTQREIFNLEQNAVEIINSASSHIVKIHSLQGKITELGAEIEHSKTRTPFERVGWTIAGVGAVLLCPLSWASALLVGFFAAFGGSGSSPLYNATYFLFREPVELCGKLFKRAINSQELWEKSIKATDSEIENIKQEVVLFVQTNDPLIEKIKNMQDAITVSTIKNDAKAILKHWEIVKNTVSPRS